jgi:hypothetical protein
MSLQAAIQPSAMPWLQAKKRGFNLRFLTKQNNQPFILKRNSSSKALLQDLQVVLA